jgi:hypothetical protein
MKSPHLNPRSQRHVDVDSPLPSVVLRETPHVRMTLQQNYSPGPIAMFKAVPKSLPQTRPVAPVMGLEVPADCLLDARLEAVAVDLGRERRVQD